MPAGRRYPTSAELTAEGVSFRIWARGRESAAIVLEDGAEYPLQAENEGHFSTTVEGLGPGTRYRVRLGEDVLDAVRVAADDLNCARRDLGRYRGTLGPVGDCQSEYEQLDQK